MAELDAGESSRLLEFGRITGRRMSNLSMDQTTMRAGTSVRYGSIGKPARPPFFDQKLKRYETMIPFKTQYEKLVRAYLKNEVRPMNPCACFIGNLLNHAGGWGKIRRAGYTCMDRFYSKRNPSGGISYYHGVRVITRQSNGTYTPDDILKLERIFMQTWLDGYKTEDALFKAFENALLELRSIHESRGEVIEDYNFKKRELVVV